MIEDLQKLPTKVVRPEYCPASHPSEVERLAENGMEDYSIAIQLGITSRTMKTWRGQYPEFDEAYLRGKAEFLDASLSMVEDALYKKALKGDTRAMQFYLKNKDPQNWKDRQEHGVSQISPEEYAKQMNLELEDTRTIYQEEVKKAVQKKLEEEEKQNYGAPPKDVSSKE